MKPDSILERLSGSTPRVLVVGDVILDQFVYGQARRISPEAPVPVVHAGLERFYPGGAANVMANLAAFGADVRGLAVIGPDPNSTRLISELAARGVRTDHFVLQSDWLTPRKHRVLADRQHLLRVDFEQPCRLNTQTFESLATAALRLIPDCRAVVISDYAKGTLTPLLIQSIVAMAHDRGIPVIVDPKGTDTARYANATVLTPNQAETVALTGQDIKDDESLVLAAGALRRDAAADWVVVTRGEQGMTVVGSTVTSIPALSVRAQDVSGAGDTVVAAIAFGLAAGLTAPQSAVIANSVAASAVEHAGIATISRDELLTAAAVMEQPHSRVTERRAMRLHAERLKRLGKRLVFTNGCFDVLHRGHVEYLQQSRALGDVLIVGLNTDASVRRLKGTGRPINSQADRAHILAGLQCVDFVVMFDEDTPYALIQELCPDVLTKGGDYDRTAVIGQDLVAETHVLNLVPGRSTSSLIHALQTTNRGCSHSDTLVAPTLRRDPRHAEPQPQILMCPER